jgi:Flp pilus assembly pilin Flp
MRRLMTRALAEEYGQDLIEYALLAGFISLVALVAISNVGTGVNGLWNDVDTKMPAIPSGSGS